MLNQKTVCENCEEPLLGEFCHKCGQKNMDTNLGFFKLIAWLFKEFINWDSKVFKTFKYLLFKPGYLSKQFRLGKRATYMHPLRLYVFCTFFYFTLVFATNSSNPSAKEDKRTFGQIIDSVQTSKAKLKAINKQKVNTPDSSKTKVKYKFDFNANQNGLQIKVPDTEEVDSIQNPLVKKFLKKMDSFDNTKINSKLLSYAPKFLFFILPVIALFLGLFYIRNKQFYFFNHFVYITHNHSFLFSWLFISTLITEIFSPSKVLGDWIDGIIFLYAFIYLFISLKVAYGQSWFKTIIKFLLISTSYIFLTVFSLLFLVVLIAILN